MKKTKRVITLVIAFIAVLLVGTYYYYNFYYDANELNINEKSWLNDHKTSVITFNIPNNLNVFASNGTGVFYDFLEDFSSTHDIKLNKNITPIAGGAGIGFVVSKDYEDKDLLIFKDHYVVISKNDEVITNFSKLDGTIGSTGEGVSRAASLGGSLTYTTYDTIEAMFEGFKTDAVKYLLVPLNENVDNILANGYKVVYHVDELTNYYYIHLGDDELFNSIVTKYYNTWTKEELEKSYYTNAYDMYVEKLSLTQMDTDSLTNRTYTYGFVPSTPYQTLSSSKYGGIVMSYLEDFSKLSNVDFTFVKYDTYDELVGAYNDKKVDLIFNNTDLSSKDFLINTNFNDRFYLVTPLSDNIKINDLSELSHYEVYVIENSMIHSYLKSFENITIKTVKNEKKLLKAIRDDQMVAIDANTYDYLVNDKIEGYHISFEGYVKMNNSFKYLNNNDAFYKLFSTYINHLSSNDMISNGFVTYKSAATNGSIVSTIAKYVLIIISIGVVIVGLVLVSKKQIKLNTKINKNEKLKFVDVLTLLKNRNYLNEKMDVWNQNTIYPQAMIVIDLNNIKYLNDTFGHEEGDKQITSAANILHQTQLDNTEIMRTDGNEFMVYMVGYTEKQVVNYLKKLVKEFNELPYEYGAAFGFSMIVDDLKLIDDAINEATIQMRDNKEIEARDEEKED